MVKRRPHGPGAKEIKGPQMYLVNGYRNLSSQQIPLGNKIANLYLTAPVNNKITQEVSCRGMKVRLFKLVYQAISRIKLQAVCRMSRCCRRADHLEFLEPWRTKLKLIQIDVEISSTIPTLRITRGFLVIQPKKTHPRCVRSWLAM